MPQVDVDGLTINYDVQGEGEPLLLIPYTSADHACYAFQLPAYTEHFSCIAIDLPGSGESDKPAGPHSTDGDADQVAAFLGAIGVEQAHVAGVSLGAAVGLHLAARHPGRVRSLSLHSCWDARSVQRLSSASPSREFATRQWAISHKVPGFDDTRASVSSPKARSSVSWCRAGCLCWIPPPWDDVRAPVVGPLAPAADRLGRRCRRRLVRDTERCPHQSIADASCVKSAL